MSNVFIYQIHHARAEAADPGYLRLDNSANERPDWYEYWPIRQFLLHEPLVETAFYGFLSPKFSAKTNLSAGAVHDFVQRHAAESDVLLFSPSLQLTACYWNVFQFGDAMHPGLLQIAEQFLSSLGAPANLEDLVSTSNNEVYSNYFVARPRFWRAWLGVTELLFARAESGTDPLARRLREPTTYRGERNVQMKIFLMERIATWLLARDASFVARARDPFAGRSRTYKLPAALVCDALKIAYLASGRQPGYRRLFDTVSRWRKPLSWLIRLGVFVRMASVRRCVQALAGYWTQAGQT